VRVIGGTCRGRVLRAPAATGTRPTSDRVREAIFDVLTGVVDLEGAAVVDLYAGSGALGIEALSRRAGSSVFVDRSPHAVRAIRDNLGALGLAERSRVVRDDVLRYLSRHHRFDLALCDPPYDFASWDRLLTRLHAAVAVLETRRPALVPPGWEIVKDKRYGDTLVTVVRSLGAHEKGTP
jgi:16S rRNA (guanine966-N2)-methyltransferase